MNQYPTFTYSNLERGFVRACRKNGTAIIVTSHHAVQGLLSGELYVEVCYSEVYNDRPIAYLYYDEQG